MSGRIPAIIYGGENQVSFSVNAVKFDKIYYSPDVFQIELDLNGSKTLCIIKDMQLHPVTGKVLHIDFLELHENKSVVVSLPVNTKGNSIGVLNGGALIMNFRKIKIKAIPANLPERITIDITELEIGDLVRIKDVNVSGCSIVQNPQAVILAVKTTRAAMAEEEVVEAEEGAEEGEGEGATPAEK